MENLPIVEFCVAIDEGDVQKIRQLVADYPVLITANVYSDGSTCLHDAAEYGTYESTKELLKLGADPNSMAGGQTPLHSAVLNAKVPTINLLLEHRADPNTISKDGETPMLIAAIRRHLFDEDDEQVVPYLLQSYGAILDLHSAAALGRLETVKQLLKANNSALQECPKPEEILSHSIRNSNPDLVEFLLKHGANPNAESKSVHLPLAKVLSKVPCDSIILNLLLDFGADPYAMIGDPPMTLYDYAKDCGQPQLILDVILQYSK